MAKKKTTSKGAQIGEYLAANPQATWKDAEAAMASLGISQGYFNSYRSKQNPKRKKKSKPSATKTAAGKSTATKTAAGKMSATRKSVTRTPAIESNLSNVVEFVRSVGGLDAAKKLLTELEEVQI